MIKVVKGLSDANQNKTRHFQSEDNPSRIGIEIFEWNVGTDIISWIRLVSNLPLELYPDPTQDAKYQCEYQIKSQQH